MKTTLVSKYVCTHKLNYIVYVELYLDMMDTSTHACISFI